MMSAKTALTPTPPAAPALAPNNTAAPPSPDGATSDFQNLLAVAAPPLAEPSLMDTLPVQPLMQLINLKNQQVAAKLATAVPGADAVAAAKPGTVSLPLPDMLQLLTDSATLLAGGAEVGAAPAEIPDEFPELEEIPKTDDDILAEWLDGMLPPSVFAPQAGSSNTGDGLGQDASSAAGAGLLPGKVTVAVPTSLQQQAGLPDLNEHMDAGSVATQTPVPGLSANREVVSTGQNPANVLIAAMANKVEVAERDKPAADGWMSAMGDLAAAKPSQDVAPAAGPRLSTPVHDSRWADALAHRLVMMARDGESVASLKLVPVDLGPLDIQISVRDGEASVHFGAAHQETRAVLEASLPRLRELLSAQGLQLANASVSHQNAGGNRPDRSTARGAVGAVAEEGEVTATKFLSTSLLDTYA